MFLKFLEQETHFKYRLICWTSWTSNFQGQIGQIDPNQVFLDTKLETSLRLPHWNSLKILPAIPSTTPATPAIVNNGRATSPRVRRRGLGFSGWWTSMAMLFATNLSITPGWKKRTPLPTSNTSNIYKTAVCCQVFLFRPSYNQWVSFWSPWKITHQFLIPTSHVHHGHSCFAHVIDVNTLHRAIVDEFLGEPTTTPKARMQSERLIWLYQYF